MAAFIDQCHLSNGLTIYSDSRTPVHELYKEVYRAQAYTPSDIPEIREGDVVVDLGANIGMFALFAASISPRVRVFAYEPMAATFSLLRKNVAANRLTNIECRQCAVSSATGERPLYITQGSTADTILLPRVKSPSTAGVSQVECVSLDDLFIRHGISRCNFLKVDIEGSEFDLICSASLQTLGRIESIAMEYHEYENRTPRELAEILTAAGFSVRIEKDRLPGLGMVYAVRPQNAGGR